MTPLFATCVQETNAAAAAGAGVDAAVAVLHIAAEPGLPRHMVAEESLQQVANLLRVQLQQNVVPFYSARLQRLLRPALSGEGVTSVRQHPLSGEGVSSVR